MVRIIEINGVDNYFIDRETGQLSTIYEPENENIVFHCKTKDGEVDIEHDSILTDNICKQRFFQLNNDKYYIYDGQQNILIQAGYIVMNNYDSERINDKDQGIKTRKSIIDLLKNVFLMHEFPVELENIPPVKKGNIMKKFEYGGYQYILFINTINGIVNLNQRRKANQLPFYPFEKNMDKYGTLYLSIFCEKVDDHAANQKDKYKVADELVNKMIAYANDEDDLNEYKFIKIYKPSKITFCKSM